MNPNEYWLGELVSYLLEQARYEREAVTMEAIDREKRAYPVVTHTHYI